MGVQSKHMFYKPAKSVSPSLTHVLRCNNTRVAFYGNDALENTKVIDLDVVCLK